MKVLVCGSRGFVDYDWIKEELAKLDVALVIHGAARGADALASQAATELGIPQQAFPADWNRYGKSAGYVRNQQMLDEGRPDLVMAFYAGRTPGTSMMVNIARKAGVEVREFNI